MTTNKNKAQLYKSNLQETPYKHLKAFVIKLLTGIATLSFLTAQVGQANATPTVIYDNGNTINAQPFYPFKRFVSSDLKHIPRYTTKAIKRFPILC